MKIVHVVRQFYPSVGGLEDVVFNLALTQQQAGHQVAIFTLNSNYQTGSALAKYQDYQSLKIYRFNWFGSSRYPICFLPPSQLNQYDIVHVHAVDFFIDYISLLKRLKLINSKLVLTTHGGFFHTNKNAKLKQVFFKTITPFSLSQCEVVTCCGIHDYKMFKPLHNKTYLIENGVSIEKFGPAKHTHKQDSYVYLGRFSSNKQIELLIELFEKHAPNNSKLYLIGQSKAGGTQLCKQYNFSSLHSNVELKLDQSDEQIIDILSQAKFVISASNYEGFGLSVVELMSYGLIPLLNETVPSFKRFVTESNTGATFQVTQQDFALRTKQLIKEWDESKAQLAKEYANQFNWKKVNQRYLDVY
ncbi:WecB/TagA/CpsF family glycosyl transferase [Catenovulum agarivorans DS-2]|uniref:WecB/TagA/CpsF family glycosyl transferase n=1 Tax=Catenovulum agarivorans DS-2 TaxID=1328313 RepID=W7QKD0_9ALTE|nr:glycosyltransferase [Catenovulum agarivorans]EWH09412.1 WecB/TagA/CpsF family glycosyl transferase [Catenovulum agarivorans DS-2]